MVGARGPWGAALIFLALGGIAAAQTSNPTDAALRFDRGEALYKEGRFAEAMKEFEEANRIAPHPSAQFNVARCLDNLGSTVAALAAYRIVLPKVDDPARRRFIRQRIRRLLSRPVKVFVHSEPAGASITIDGNEKPEPKPTPAVVELVPGVHVILLRLDGHQLAARRVLVEPDKEQVAQVKLDPLPRAGEPGRGPAPREECATLVDARALHLNAGVVGAVGWTTELATGVGLGAQLLVSFKRLIFGGHFLWLFAGEERIEKLTIGSATYDKANSRWLLAQFEGGYVFPLRTSYLYTTLGLGVSTERIVFVGTLLGQDDDFVREEFGFSWSLGGGIEAMAARWVSFGVHGRMGMIHGNRVNQENPSVRSKDVHHYPYGTLWASATFHL